jgi:hypothetical protein
MSSASPQRRLTVAEMYFYTELRSSLGHMVAEHWLSGTSASCAGLRHDSPVANTPTAELPTERHKNDQLEKSLRIQDSWSQPQASTPISADDTPRSFSRSFSSESLASDIERFSSDVLHKCHGTMLKSRIMSHSWLARKHGDKAGLLFTDAAHELLDYSSPIVSRCCSVLSRCCSSADPKVSEYQSDPSLWHVASWFWSTRRSSVSNNDCFVGLIVLIVAFLLSIILGCRV